jgi:putative hydrolase of the HAD superfamily
MPAAVLFDFYGTLACWHDVHRSGYVGVFEQFGYTLPGPVLDAYITRYDGIEHLEHSTDADTYEAWVRLRLRQLATTCGAGPDDLDRLVDALRKADQAEMVPYPEVASTLRRLRAAGLTVGVCSNWGWALEPCLDQVGLLPLVDAAVTSARAGARKPHPRMYAASLAALGADAADVLFVGDSWGPDVVGPREAGMASVHVWRADERLGQVPPELREGDRRVGDLSELLEILALS